MSPKISSTNPQPLEVLIHIVSWLLIFAFPLLFISRSTGTSLNWVIYLRHLCTPLAFGIIFYCNYSLLVPRLLFTKKKRTRFFLYNILLVVALSASVHLSSEWLRRAAEAEFPDRPERSVTDDRPAPPPRWAFWMSDTIMMCATVGLASALRMSREWKKADTARREAELKNLRNQLNPHFLLNTLNNIYALIAFDVDKAQEAVQDLSRLLRYVLYENKERYVPLGQEADFIRNYVELMRIRISPEVQIETDIRIRPDSTTQIAPLIFISLIENAFKHGISPKAQSFIRISLTEDGDGRVCCAIVNSNFPKNSSDKSGSGIGLEQVSRRLELLYPNRFHWDKGTEQEGKIYSSILTIRTTEERGGQSLKNLIRLNS